MPDDPKALGEAKKSEVEVKKAEADVRKTVADAKKMEADAAKVNADTKDLEAKTRAANIANDLAARKAVFGAVSASTFAGGEVTLTEGAGNAEATLLAAKATADAAQQIAAAVTSKIGHHSRPVVIIAGQQRLSFVHLDGFEAQRILVAEAFRSANTLKAYADALGGMEKKLPAEEDKEKAGDKSEVGEFDEGNTNRARMAATLAGSPIAVAAAGAGAVLEFGAKIASYFQSDYKVGSAKVAGIDDDFLAVAVAGRLSNCIYPGRWMKTAPMADVFTLLDSLDTQRREAVAALAETKRQAYAARKNKQADIAKAYDDAAAAYAKALAGYDGLIAGLMGADADKLPAVLKIAEELALSHRIENKYLLFIRVNSVIGANYARKSIWNRPWRMPFYVMGGIVANYMLIDSAASTVICAGQTARHGGYYSVNNVAEAMEAWIARRPKPSSARG